MAGRYVFTPARRAALKRAAAKSAAKRKGRKTYRQERRKLAKQINADYRRNPSRAAYKKAQRTYDRKSNDLAVKHKGSKRRSDRYLKNRRRAGTAAQYAVALTPYVAMNVVARNQQIKQQFGNKANYKLHKGAAKKQRAFDKKVNKATGPKARAKATRKAQKSYNKAQTANNRADRRDERRSGIKRNATGKRKVKSSRVYGPGNVMVSQKALTSGRR